MPTKNPGNPCIDTGAQRPARSARRHCAHQSYTGYCPPAAAYCACGSVQKESAERVFLPDADAAPPWAKKGRMEKANSFAQLESFQNSVTNGDRRIVAGEEW